ncbi:hypothetical protein ACGFNU_31915 [Spirillospora sp. NPDC048911]|uniref:hypothetical protein n=1 Tax=Spirillospora sp. NPDC048911 TaxID=3364527 RepID=UPI0037236FB0
MKNSEKATSGGEPKAESNRGRFSFSVMLLAALIIGGGGTAAWAAKAKNDLSATPAAQNLALTDTARTSDVKGQVASAVSTVFSYSYADTAKTERAAQKLLTGKAVQQYNQMFARVRQQAPQMKQVLTTTVTDAAVVTLKPDSGRLLVFADQRNTSIGDTGKKDPKDKSTGGGKTAASAAVFAVEVVRDDGIWKITGIDTFGA